MNCAKKGWNNSKRYLDKFGHYTLIETKNILLHKNYYMTLSGRSKNRVLMRDNPKLYNSIYRHTSALENIFPYKGNYNFTRRIKFIIDYECDINKLLCVCGANYTYGTYCNRCPDIKRTQLGKPHTSKTKQKIRNSTIKYITESKGKCVPRYNRDSIRIIENFGKKYNYNFRHAENGGEYYLKELGYFLDAYDKENNIVLEIDEKHHFKNGKLRKKDVVRQKEIEEYLNCRFIRIAL